MDTTPLDGLRLRTPRLELRLPTTDGLLDLAHLARQGIHPPETMPFRVAWSDEAASPGFVDDFVAFHQDARASWQPESWSLPLGVWLGDQPVGIQAINGERFASERRFETGSWLGARFQGQGLGTEMRGAVLELGFSGLGAVMAVSGAFDGNAASARLSQKLGYVEAGEAFSTPRGTAQRSVIYELGRRSWLARPRPPVEVVGLEPCLALFGL